MMNARALCGLMLLGFLCACGGGNEKPPYTGVKIGKPYEVYGRWYKPQYNSHYDEIGLASWYGPGFHGGSTASGERFDQDAMTAAHKTLPLPSIVRVTNLDNGLSAIVKVNDRGPFSHERIIDLSRGAAKRLGVIRTGTARVRVQFLDKETQEYVQNMQNGTQYAMNKLSNVNPQEAADREEQGTKPSFRVEPRMFADNGAPSTSVIDRTVPPSPVPVAPAASVFSVVDDAQAVPDMPPVIQHPAKQSYSPSTYQAPLLPPTKGFSTPANTGFFIQAGTFGKQENAFALVDQIDDVDGPQVMKIMLNGKKLYRVMIGPYRNRDTAKNMLSKLASMGIPDAKILHN